MRVLDEETVFVCFLPIFGCCCFFWGGVPRCCDGHLSQGIPFRLKKVLFSVAQYFKEQCRARAGSFD